MKIRFWGTRGSIPSPGPGTIRYGGNCSCVEVRTDDGDLFIIDAGTGIRELGLALMNEQPVVAHILLSHTHWDHISGFPFFPPAFVPSNTLTIYAARNICGESYDIWDVNVDDEYHEEVRKPEVTRKSQGDRLVPQAVQGDPLLELFDPSRLVRSEG